MLSKVYSSLTKFFNKFYNIQGMSQHLGNKQNVNILKHIYTYLISMGFTMTYKISQNFVQKVTTYIQGRVLQVLTQLILCWLYFLILQEQLSLQCLWSEDMIQMIFPFYISWNALEYKFPPSLWSENLT